MTEKEARAARNLASQNLREAERVLKQVRLREADVKDAEVRVVAVLLHDALCSYNHTDGCGWGYEKDSWQSDDHARWFRKAEHVCSEVGIEEASRFAKMAKKLKTDMPQFFRLFRMTHGHH